MTGNLVARIAQRLVHARTFTLVVSPAIADLQCEVEKAGKRTRLDSYFAVWVAVAGALWQDLVWDPRRPAWADDVSVTVRLVFLVASYHLSMLTLVLGFDHRINMAFIGRLFASITGDRPVMMVAIVFAAATLFVAAKAHGAERPDHVGVVDG